MAVDAGLEVERAPGLAFFCITTSLSA